MEIEEEKVETPGKDPEKQEGTPGAEAASSSQKTAQDGGEGEQIQEKLLAGKYRTQEELERAYLEQNREATRMAQELAKTKAQPQQQQGTQDQWEQYNDDTLRAWKKQYPEHADLIDAKLQERIEKRAIKSAESKVLTMMDRMLASNLHPDFANPQSELHQLASKIYYDEKPYLKDQQDGTSTAVELAMARLGLQAKEKAKSEGRKEVIDTLKAAQTAAGTRAGSSAGATPKAVDYDKLSPQEMLAEIERVKMGGKINA